MKTTYKATQQDIKMPVDKILQKTILKYFFWGLGIFTFWVTLGINFLFYLLR